MTVTININAIDPKVSREQAEGLVRNRSLFTSLLSKLSLYKEEFKREGTYYYPIYLLYSSVRIKKPFSQWRQLKQLCALDGITGRYGIVDYTLPEIKEIELASEKVMSSQFSKDTVVARGVQHFCRYVERCHKPVSAETYNIDMVKEVYLPYYVFSTASGTKVFTVDSLTGRVDPIKETPVLEQLYFGMP
ncbi:MAG: hypothetical protein SCK28_00840 [Bacillota bacterium]|nr:hypothetical protein [Bacillota bacterium]